MQNPSNIAFGTFLFLNQYKLFSTSPHFLNWCKRFQLLQLLLWDWSQEYTIFSLSHVCVMLISSLFTFITKLKIPYFHSLRSLTLGVENLSWAKALQKRSGSSKLCLPRESNKFSSNHSFTTRNLQSLFKICYLYIV